MNGHWYPMKEVFRWVLVREFTLPHLGQVFEVARDSDNNELKFWSKKTAEFTAGLLNQVLNIAARIEDAPVGIASLTNRGPLVEPEDWNAVAALYGQRVALVRLEQQEGATHDRD